MDERKRRRRQKNFFVSFSFFSIRDVKTNLAVVVDTRFFRLYNLKGQTKAMEAAQLALFQTQPESVSPFLKVLSYTRGLEFLMKVISNIIDVIFM